MTILKTELANQQSEKTCEGCYFNHGPDDITCHKFYDLDKEYEDVECYDEARNEHLIFINLLEEK